MPAQPKREPTSARTAVLGGAAITTTMAMFLVDPKLGWRPNVMFVAGMAAVGALTGGAMAVQGQLGLR